eukprot:scaffold111804_cov17-Prasinocladus_malaysianus.AAC.1
MSMSQPMRRLRPAEPAKTLRAATGQVVKAAVAVYTTSNAMTTSGSSRNSRTKQSLVLSP